VVRYHQLRAWRRLAPSKQHLEPLLPPLYLNKQEEVCLVVVLPRVEGSLQDSEETLRVLWVVLAAVRTCRHLLLEQPCVKPTRVTLIHMQPYSTHTSQMSWRQNARPTKKCSASKKSKNCSIILLEFQAWPTPPPEQTQIFSWLLFTIDGLWSHQSLRYPYRSAARSNVTEGG